MAGPHRRAAFVASGGGAKGLFHLGVLRACEEADIDLQVLVGTSAGAMACAFVAAGLSAEDLIAPFRGARAVRRWGEYRSPLPFISRPNQELFTRLFRSRGVLRADGMERFVRRTLPANEFAALPRDLHVIATDLASSERVVFDRSSPVLVSQAVAGSMAIPIVFRPYRVEGRECIDGSISRTFSVDVARDAGADLIVASMVHSPFREAGAGSGFPHRGMLRIFQQSISTMARGRGLMELELCRARRPDLPVVLVEPARRDPSMLNAFSPRIAWEQIVSGYAAGRRALREGGFLGDDGG